jgi:hypothetical protein
MDHEAVEWVYLRCPHFGTYTKFQPKYTLVIYQGESAREETSPVIRKTISRTRQTPWVSIEKAILYKAKTGIGLGMTPITAQLLAINDNEKEFGVDLSLFKTQLPGDDPEMVILPTDFGKELGISGVKVDKLLEKAGLQMQTIMGRKDGKDKWEWQVTERGDFCEANSGHHKEEWCGNNEIQDSVVRNGFGAIKSGCYSR